MATHGDFRKFYNDHLHRELSKMEFQRRKLVALFVFSILTFIAIGVFVWSLHIPILVLFLWLPVLVWSTILAYQIRKFRAQFKPTIIPLILKFIDPEYKFYPQDYIPYDTFKRSGLFGEYPSVYEGEDYIKGNIGEITFEMSELNVKIASRVRNRLDQMFRGVFFHAKTYETFEGRINIIPKENWQFNTRTIKAITKSGGKRIENLGEDFDKWFMAYAQTDIKIRYILTDALIQGMVQFRLRTGKRVYFAFVNGHMYIAVFEPEDLLEPYILRSNKSFERILAFYEDLRLFTGLVQDFDLGH